MPNPRRRFDISLARFKLRYFEVLSTVVVLVLFTAFAIHEIMPVIKDLWDFFHAP